MGERHTTTRRNVQIRIERSEVDAVLRAAFPSIPARAQMELRPAGAVYAIDAETDTVTDPLPKASAVTPRSE